MAYAIIGLGNPGAEYEKTRHNTGRMILEVFRKKNGFPAWAHSKKLNALISEGIIGEEKVRLVLPETFMNKSGSAVRPLIKSKKQAERLVVVCDDLDLPLGTIKISFGKSSGGHKGVESVIHAIKTKDFIRVRIGISPATANGLARKPKGEKRVIDFILGRFTPSEEKRMKAVAKKASEALETIIREGKEKAMNIFN